MFKNTVTLKISDLDTYATNAHLNLNATIKNVARVRENVIIILDEFNFELNSLFKVCNFEKCRDLPSTKG